jgi:hypothetical protein
MIDDQIYLTLRVDFGWVGAHFLDSGSHSGKINYSWDSREILEDNSGRLEWNFHTLGSVLLPVENGFDVTLCI